MVWCLILVCYLAVYIKPDSSSPSQQTTTESTAAKPVAEEDDDDEDALRQLLLKSLANKKKVRQVSYMEIEKVGFEPMTILLLDESWTTSVNNLGFILTCSIIYPPTGWKSRNENYHHFRSGYFRSEHFRSKLFRYEHTAEPVTCDSGRCHEISKGPGEANANGTNGYSWAKPFHSQVQKSHSPSLFREIYISEVLSIRSIVISHLSKLRKAKFFILCNIPGEAAGEIWNWSLLGRRLLVLFIYLFLCFCRRCLLLHSMTQW